MWRGRLSVQTFTVVTCFGLSTIDSLGTGGAEENPTKTWTLLVLLPDVEDTAVEDSNIRVLNDGI